METMNLNDSGESMTPLFSAPISGKGKQPEPTGSSGGAKLVYKPDVEPEPEKNKSKPKEMDSTPLSDVMMSGDAEFQSGGGADPRFMMAPNPAYVQQQMPAPSGYQQQKPAVQSKNPMNLTDEQMEALLAGAVALLAFSGFAQEKLSTLVPKFLDEAGKQSTVGMLVTALLAAILFYFGRRFVVKD